MLPGRTLTPSSESVLIGGVAGPMDWGLIGVAGAVTFAIFLNNVVFTPIYTAMILRVSPVRFYSGLIKVTAATAVFFTFAKGVDTFVAPDSWLGLCLSGITLATVFSVLAVFGGLNRHDREALRNWIAGK